MSRVVLANSCALANDKGRCLGTGEKISIKHEYRNGFCEGYTERDATVGANIELDIFLRKGYLTYKQIFSFLEQRGLRLSVTAMITFVDWNYEHVRHVNPEEILAQDVPVFLDRFSLIHFYLNETRRCTLITSFEENHLNLSFGLDTETLDGGESLKKMNYIHLLYDQTANMIDELLSNESIKKLFLVASMGMEYSVTFDSDFQKMLDDDNGAIKFVLAKESSKDIHSAFFQKEAKRNCTIFSLLSDIEISICY